MLTKAEFKRLSERLKKGKPLTKAEKAALRPYKVKNAILMAAGMSNRFAPISYEMPKGLVRVKGEILVERQIRQLKEAGIDDITLVVGYMKEKFFYLKDMFGVKIVVNEDYYRYNNPSTLICVSDQLSNTYICSSDNYFTENVFEPYVYEGYYSCVYSDGPTDEDCVHCDRHGIIKKLDIGGGCDIWFQLGHAYYDRAFSKKFKKILAKEISNPETLAHVWEHMYARHLDELKLHIRKYDRSVIWEFDSLEDLRKFDPAFIDNVDSRIFKNICNYLKCSPRDIVEIAAVTTEPADTSFRFTVNGKEYVYRHSDSKDGWIITPQQH